MSRWWRAYDEAVDDPKLILLGDRLGWAWFKLMCVASKNNGVLPSIRDVSFWLRISEQKAAATITELVSAGLLDKREDGRFEPHNWSVRQYRSDGSADRVKRHREKRVAAGLEGQWFAPKELRKSVYKADNFECVYCGATEFLSLDHKISELSGGTHEIENLVTACRSCNGAKRDLPFDEFVSRSKIETLHGRFKERAQTTDNRAESERKESCSNPFERFWKAYPRRVGKKVAERALAKALRETSIDAILGAVSRQASSWTDPQFIPHPSTWLNAGRWADEGYRPNGPARQYTAEEIAKGREWYARKKAAEAAAE